MKTQNKNNKLTFNKSNVTELNNKQLANVNGGWRTTIIIDIITTVTTLTDGDSRPQL